MCETLDPLDASKTSVTLIPRGWRYMEGVGRFCRRGIVTENSVCQLEFEVLGWGGGGVVSKRVADWDERFRK